MNHERETTFAEVWAALPWRTRAWLWFDKQPAREAFDRAMATWHPDDRLAAGSETVFVSEAVTVDRWRARANYWSTSAVPLWLLSIVIQILVKLWLDRGDDAMKNLRG